MSKADQFENVAKTLRTVASKYTNASSQVSKQTSGLDLVTTGLLTGPDRWAGLAAPQAFQTAWNQAQEDSSNITTAFGHAVGHMTSLAATIETNVPAIRAAESMQQSGIFMSVSTTPTAAQTAFQDALNTAVQNSQTAIDAIAMAVDSMSTQLEDDAQQIGVCSTGDKTKDQQAQDNTNQAKKQKKRSQGRGGKTRRKSPPQPKPPLRWWEKLNQFMNDWMDGKGQWQVRGRAAWLAKLITVGRYGLVGMGSNLLWVGPSLFLSGDLGTDTLIALAGGAGSGALLGYFGSSFIVDYVVSALAGGSSELVAGLKQRLDQLSLDQTQLANDEAQLAADQKASPPDPTVLNRDQQLIANDKQKISDDSPGILKLFVPAADLPGQ